MSLALGIFAVFLMAMFVACSVFLVIEGFRDKTCTYCGRPWSQHGTGQGRLP